MKNSKFIFVLALILMVISVGGVSAVDTADIAVSDAVALDDGLNIQTISVDNSALDDDVVIYSNSDNSTSQTWEVDDSNYANYFDLDDEDHPGIIKSDSQIKSGDTLKLGNISNKIICIDRTLNIIPLNKESVLTNSMIQLISGADNSVISGFTVLIDTASITDISNQLFCFAASDVNNIYVKDNIFKSWSKKTAGKNASYAMALANVNNSIFTNNTIHSIKILDNGTKLGDGGTTIQIVHSSNNIISYNDIQSNGANCIYFTPGISQIWTKPSDLNLSSVNNIIEYNIINANSLTTNGMAFMVQHYSNTGADNNTYRFNEICNGGVGISSSGGKGEICYNNTIYNVGTGIMGGVNNFIIYNNIINATTGISASGSSQVYNNIITTTSTGIITGGSAQVYDNIINVNSTANGIGISVTTVMDGGLIKNNKIDVGANKSAIGIKYTGGSASVGSGVISDNIIVVNDLNNGSSGINIGSTADTAAATISNITVSNNDITSQKIGIVLNKTKDCVVSDNIINVLGDDCYGVYVASSKATTAVAPISNNNIISGNKINAKTGIKVGDSTCKKSISNLVISNNNIVSNITAIEICDTPTNLSDITIDNNDITVDGVVDKNSYAILADNVTNLNIEGNTIKFTANADGTSTQYAVSLSNIENLVFDFNKIDAKLPSLVVGYDPITWAALYSDLGFYLVDSNNIVIKNNEFNVVDTVNATGYDTLYNIYLKGDSNLLFDSNDVITSGSNYVYGVKIEGYYVFDDDYEMIYINSTNVIIKNNNIKSTSDSYYAAGFELGGPLDSTIYNNKIQVDAVSVTYAIYAAGYNGPIDLIIDNNQIGTSSNSGYGIELYGCKEVTVSSNKLNLKGNYTMGIATSSVLTTIVSNEISTKGECLGTPTSGDGFGSDNIGIFANSYADSIFVSSNTIYSSAYGIISNCKKANIINNEIEVAGNNSIGIKTNAYSNIMGNTITSKGIDECCELGLPTTTITGILATSDARIIAHDNKITTNGNYSIDLTDSCKYSFVENIISNNYLVANKVVGDDSVTFSEGCAYNSIICDNTPIVAVITVSNVVKYYGNSTNLVATIKDNHGNIIAGKTVSITIGKSTYTVATDKNGMVSLTLNQAKGTYTATIKVDGVNYVTVTKKVSIKVVSPTMKAVKTTVKKGKYFQVIFKDANGKVIKNQKVTFKVNGKTYTATTNSKGIAQVKLTKKGTFNVVVGFKNINPYGKTTSTIKVKVS